MEGLMKRPSNVTHITEEEKQNELEQLNFCLKYFERIGVPSAEGTPHFYENLRILINCLHRTPPDLKDATRETIRDISASLICTAATCDLQLDGQLLCSTAFCSALCSILTVAKLTENLLTFLETSDKLCVDYGNLKRRILVKNLEVFKVCLCHGIIQSGVLKFVIQYRQNKSSLLDKMFDLLEDSCMKYSRLTSITFKILVSWVKKTYLELNTHVTINNIKKIFFIINSNWESPINGVKEQNAKLFEILLDVCSKSCFWRVENSNDEIFQNTENMLRHIIEDQPWKMKSKYFMLSTLVIRYGAKELFAAFPDVTDGLISSLSYSHLTSAGSDLYQNCINGLDMQDWITIFNSPVLAIMCDKKKVVTIEKQNLFNYWIPATLKRFPSILDTLLQQIVKSTSEVEYENSLYAIISLFKVGRKRGSVMNVWNGKFSSDVCNYSVFFRLLQCGLEHSNEIIRSEAFATVCLSTKATIMPSITEFELVQHFIMNNISADNSSLRQSIMNSFALFLTRLVESSVYELKCQDKRVSEKKSVVAGTQEEKKNHINESGIIRGIEFLEWIYYFIVSGIEPGVNYQRKILCLQLYEMILSYFQKSAHTQNNIRKRKGFKLNGGVRLLEYARQHGRWHYGSEKNIKILLSCVLDSNDDIREAAGFILTEYFSVEERELDVSLFDHALKLCNSPMFYDAESGALLLQVIGNWTYRVSEKKPVQTLKNLIDIKLIETNNKTMPQMKTESRNINSSRSLGTERSKSLNEENAIEGSAAKKVVIKKKAGDTDYDQDRSITKETSPPQFSFVARTQNEPKDRSITTETFENSGLEGTDAPLSIFLLSQAESQLDFLKSDIFQAAASGFPLHGTLTALARISTQIGSPEYGRMATEEIDRTVTLLEQIVMFLLNLLAAKTDTNSGVAPSFAEMDMAIKSIIQESGSYPETDEYQYCVSEDTQLSPAHQLVLNCLWLNMKVCCTLSSGLVSSKNCSAETVQRCGNIITQVLTRCRHKGAIESAGVAMSSFVKNASCNHESKQDVQIMLKNFLEEFLVSFKCGNSKGSVTRRSAGLSILVQRIIASDTQPGKPLLHMCVRELLVLAKTPPNRSVLADPKSVLTDLPQAQSLHFLRSLVQDSSVRQDMAQYMSSVSVVCFSTFTSPIWTVRNAALQLAGVLIPKLVGQKKVQDEEGTLGSSTSVEEFFSHFPELTDFILTTLQTATNCHPKEALKYHADLIPMLSLLAKVAVGVEEFISIPIHEKINKYCIVLNQLLSSPIYHVRKLAAKTYERFISLPKAYEAIIGMITRLKLIFINCDRNPRENEVNGVLFALKYLTEKLKHENKTISGLNIAVLLKNICLNSNKFTYFNKLLLMQLLEDNSNEVTYTTDDTHRHMLMIQKTLSKEKESPTFQPGLFLWAAKVIEFSIKHCHPQDVIRTWYNAYTLFSTYPDIVQVTFTSLNWRLRNNEQIDGSSKWLLFVLLLKINSEMPKNYISYVLLPVLNTMLMLINELHIEIIPSTFDMCSVASWCFTDECNKSAYSMIALPVASGLIAQYFRITPNVVPCAELDFVVKITKCIKERSDPSKYNEDFRLNVAKAINILAECLVDVFGTVLKRRDNETLRNVIETNLDVEIDLLQDEDNLVRKEAAKFTSICLTKLKSSASFLLITNPYSSLQKLVEPSMLLSFLPAKYAVDLLWKKLQYKEELEYCLTSSCSKNIDLNSPFDHGTSNIYSEGTKMVDLFGKNLCSILRTVEMADKQHLISCIPSVQVSFGDDIREISKLLDNIETCGISSSASKHTIYYIVAKKMICLSKLMDALKIKIEHDTKSEIKKLEVRFVIK